LVSFSLVEFVLELNPVKSEGVKEGLHEIHAEEHSESDSEEEEIGKEQL
jgi:hypothetical protein